MSLARETPNRSDTERSNAATGDQILQSANIDTGIHKLDRERGQSRGAMLNARLAVIGTDWPSSQPATGRGTGGTAFAWSRYWMKGLRLLTFAGGLVLLFVASCPQGFAKNLYIRSGASGANNGSDWNNAWTGFNSISWGSGANQAAPGDTIWVAGGTYGQTWVPAGSGTSSGWITIMRVQSTDSVPTSAAGWSSAFDSQVVINDANGGNGMTFGGQGNYLYIDGRVDSGIQIVGHNNSGGYCCVQYTAGTTGNTFTNVDFAGSWNGVGNPGMVADTRCINATAWNGSSYMAINNLTITHSRLHGMGNLMWLYNVQNGTIEYCQMYDNLADNGYHANVCITAASDNIMFRYNNIYNWQIEGILMSPSGNAPGANWYIYGNIWHDGYAEPSYPRILSSQDTTTGNGPIYFYNNTIVNCYEGVVVENGGFYASGCVGRNNIYYNVWGGGTPGQPATQSSPTEGLGNDDYDFCDRAVGNNFGNGAHDIGSGSNPFVSLGSNYQLVSAIGNTYPRNKGVAIANVGANTFNLDMLGDVRGADGAWDIGAYEYGSGVVPTNPVISVSPSSLSFGSILTNTTGTNSFTVQNSGAGTLQGTASVPAPFSIVSGGSYSLGAGQSTNVVVSFTPGGSTNSVNQTVAFTGGGGTTASVSGMGMILALIAGLSFPSYAGTITPPMAINSSGGYIYSTVDVSNDGQAGVGAGGLATYWFTITNAGSYTISAMVSAPNDGQKSLWVNIDSLPVDPTMIWDVYPWTTNGLQLETVSWRGSSNTDTNDQYNPQVWSLTSGAHQLIIAGREAGVELGNITINPYTSGRPTPPVAPANLRVVSAH